MSQVEGVLRIEWVMQIFILSDFVIGVQRAFVVCESQAGCGAHCVAGAAKFGALPFSDCLGASRFA
jgi:hypothetical protein